jgi:hypothetical protein
MAAPKTPKTYQQSRYFAFDMEEALHYTGDEIIKAIVKRYPKINYILVTRSHQVLYSKYTPTLSMILMNLMSTKTC